MYVNVNGVLNITPIYIYLGIIQIYKLYAYCESTMGLLHSPDTVLKYKTLT